MVVKFINRYFDGNEIVSGSLALNMFLQRKSRDIDMISSKPYRFGDLYKENYPEWGWEFPKEYCGSFDFSTRTFWGRVFSRDNRYQKVDFFKYDTNYFEWNGIKIQDPLDIIKKKSDIILNADSNDVKEKHSSDLEIIGMKVLHGIDVARRSFTGNFCLPY